jgi:ribonucleoside-diphosphate reductase alpha chain
MNLQKYVNYNCNTNKTEFDYYALYIDTKVAFKALNDVLHESISLLPYKELQESVNDWRINGMGHMGIADVLIELQIKYGSNQSIDFAEKIQQTILEACVEASVEDVDRYGLYKYYDFEYLKDNIMFKNCINTKLQKLVKQKGLSNSAFCTVAPTGSLSSMLGVSGGVEPLYAFSYTRKTESLHDENVYYKIYTPIVEKYINKHNITDENDLPDYLKENKEKYKHLFA